MNDTAVQLRTRIDRDLLHAQTGLSALILAMPDPTTRDQLRKAMVAVKKLRNQLEDLLLAAVDDEAMP